MNTRFYRSAHRLCKMAYVALKPYDVGRSIDARGHLGPWMPSACRLPDDEQFHHLSMRKQQTPSPLSSVCSYSSETRFNSPTEDHRPTPPYPVMSTFAVYDGASMHRIDPAHYVTPALGPNALYANGDCRCLPVQVPPVEATPAAATHKTIDAVAFVTGAPLYYVPEQIRRLTRQSSRLYVPRVAVRRITAPRNAQVNSQQNRQPTLTLGAYVEMNVPTTSQVVRRAGFGLPTQSCVRYPSMC